MNKIRKQNNSSKSLGDKAPKSPLPIVATALRIWQHSHLLPLKELSEDLQDRILILRNHPKVSAMSHNRGLISYAAHQDYLRELQRRQPKFDCCALFCDAIRMLKAEQSPTDVDVGNLKILRPIIGIVNVDMRIAARPLLGLYKNFYHYPHIKMGRALLFAAMLRASELGLREVFMECYIQNIAMQKLARQLGFLPQETVGEVLNFQRYLPSSKKLLQDPMFSDFAELKRETASLHSSC